MNGLQFQESQKPKQPQHHYHVQPQQRTTTAIKSPRPNELNSVIKTTPNFVDKNQELVIPLNKGKKILFLEKKLSQKLKIEFYF